MDYKKIGLKVGLEIHQQLEGRKLFCECPTILRDDKPDISLKRNLRAAAGETGEVDIAAKHEQAKELHFVYEGYSDTTCLVEMDEEPPHPMNQEALDVALLISKMMNANAVDEVQIMRKTVVDGSNTSGFQRTSLVGMNGKLDDVGIQTICIEEDAAKIIGKEKDAAVYRLDRLGIPLVEIATDPDIKTPEQAKEVAQKIGMLLRSTGKAKRGIGTIRQDLNISIKGGARIEIKGAQDLKLLPLMVENEANRQLKLIEIKEKVKDSKVSDPVDVSSVFSKTKCEFVKKGISKGEALMAIKLEGFSGLLGEELMPSFRLGTELAGYAKTRGFGGVIHSDEELANYNFTEKEINELEKKLSAKKKDAWLMVLGNGKKAEKMLVELLIPRIKQLSKGIPNEVRQAKPDGTSIFMRPMPGSARMYPETDAPPIKISADRMKALKIPELIEETGKRYQKMGLGKDLAELLAKSEKKELFDRFAEEFKQIKPAFIAETLIPTLKEISRKHKMDVSIIKERQMEEIFVALNNSEISKESVYDLLVDCASGKGLNMDSYKLISDDELKKELDRIVKENTGAPFGAIMGKAMQKLKGKADGKKIADMLKELT